MNNDCLIDGRVTNLNREALRHDTLYLEAINP